jgi:hypothetical protein
VTIAPITQVHVAHKEEEMPSLVVAYRMREQSMNELGTVWWRMLMHEDAMYIRHHVAIIPYKQKGGLPEYSVDHYDNGIAYHGKFSEFTYGC